MANLTVKLYSVQDALIGLSFFLGPQNYFSVGNIGGAKSDIDLRMMRVTSDLSGSLFD